MSRSQRPGVLFGVALSLYLVAAGCAFAVFAGYGRVGGKVRYQVADVVEGYDAAGKLEPGDLILAVDGEPIYLEIEGVLADNLPAIIRESGGRPLAFTVRREGRELEVEVAPQEADDPPAGRDEPAYRVGILLDVAPPQLSLAAAAGRALADPARLVWEDLRDRVASLLEALRKEQREEEVVGPIGVASLVEAELTPGWVRALGVIEAAAAWLALLALAGAAILLPVARRRARRSQPTPEASGSGQVG